MNEPFQEPLTVWRFIRRYFVRIVIVAFLATLVFGAMLVWMPYQREQRIAKEFEAYGGKVEWQYAGPNWIPQSIRDRTTLFSRVREVDLGRTQITDAGMENLKGLTKLKVLYLSKTKVTDTSLAHFKGLTELKGLVLEDTKITDAGLEHLKGLTNLVVIDLNGTPTTSKGRAMLREAFPNCVIRWTQFQFQLPNHSPNP